MNILKSGATGILVEQLQQDLQILGYTVTVDGDFGPGTQTAVIQFQQDHQLPADGIAGPITLAELNTLIGALVQGIDISHLNGPVNWATLSADHISFVFCKASEGAGFTDPQFKNNLAGATTINMLFGPYHFLHFQGATAQEQADNFLNCGVDFSKPGILPPVLDIEWQVPASLNPYILANRSACIQLISDWLDIVSAKTGRTPIIYTNMDFWSSYLDNSPGFGNYPLWIAAYQRDHPDLPAGWNSYAFWQFSGSGGISSVQGAVDRDLFKGSTAALKNLANG